MITNQEGLIDFIPKKTKTEIKSIRQILWFIHNFVDYGHFSRINCSKI